MPTLRRVDAFENLWFPRTIKARRELLREPGVVLLLLGVEPEVLEEYRLAAAQLGNGRAHFRTDAVRKQRYAFSEER